MKKIIIVFCLLFVLGGCATTKKTVRYKTAAVGDVDDAVITNVTILDVENSKVLFNQDMVIKDGIIQSIEKHSGSPPLPGNVIDGTDLVAMPGFVNTHSHLWQHAAKGFYPAGNLQEWIGIYRVAHYFTEEELYDVMLAASCQAVLSGITTISDFASVNFREFSLDAVCRAIVDSGMEGNVVFWYPAAFYPDGIKEKEILRLKKTYSDHLDIWMGPGPLSFYTPPLVYGGIHMAHKLNLRLSEHTMENVQEQVAFYSNLKGYLDTNGAKLGKKDLEKLREILAPGPPSKVPALEQWYRLARQTLAVDEEMEGKGPALTDEEKNRLRRLLAELKPTISPMPLLEYLGALEDSVAVHSVWLTQADIDIIKKIEAGNKHHVYISHNPESNMYLSSGISPVRDYIKQGLIVTLATDGAASNDGIDFFSSMRALWNSQKLSYLDSRVIRTIEPWEIIKIATINGAKALGLGDKTGSIAVGKEADIILLSKKRLGMAPFVPTERPTEEKYASNIIPLIIYSSGVRDIDTVLSDGKIVVRNGGLQLHSEEKLARKMSTVINETLARVSKGKKVAEAFSLDAETMKDYWRRYHSVRKKDEFDVTIHNAGKKDITVRVAVTGEKRTFGNTLTQMISKDVTDRFPCADPQAYFDESSPLKNNESIRFTKAKGIYRYEITKLTDESKPKVVEFKRGGQILFLVESK